MLVQIEIKDFAIIEHSIINFEAGFNVITGETGAGKSILFDALSSIIGERTSKDYVRKGKEKAELKAVFLKTEELANRLKEKNIEIPDDVIIIKRTISSTGRSIAKVNGSIQTTQTIKDICQDLIEICGQKAHLELLQEDKYLHWLDNHSDSTHKKRLSEFQTKYSTYKLLNKELNDLMNKEREQEQLLDLYRFQKEEIEKVNLKLGEDSELEDEERFLASFDEIKKNTSHTLDSLSSIENLYDSKEYLKKASRFDNTLFDYIDRIEKAYYELEDVKRELDSYISNIEYDESRLNQVVHRLETIKQLKRKYADTIEGILSHYEDVSRKIDDFDNKEENIAKMQNELKTLESELRNISDKLNLNRTVVANKLSNSIIHSLKELCMPDAIFKFEVSKMKEFNSLGFSKVNILFNANKGEEPKPLSKIASGGELSRVLLAMKISSNSIDEVDSIVFDEIDEGIGGEVGRVIGQKLYELGKRTQVIVISHLPQVAAKANQHFLIKKSIKEERTVSNVIQLSEKQRVQEIARMIYGDEMNDTTIKQAEEMLKK